MAQAPQPKALAVAKGLYRPSRHEDQIADTGLEFLTSIPEPISELDEAGLRIWNGVCTAALKSEGWIAYTDLPLLDSYCYNCQTYYRMRKADHIAEQKQGRLTTAEYKIMRESEKVMISLAARFGLDPSSRTRIKLKSPDEIDEFTALKL